MRKETTLFDDCKTNEKVSIMGVKGKLVKTRCLGEGRHSVICNLSVKDMPNNLNVGNDAEMEVDSKKEKAHPISLEFAGL